MRRDALTAAALAAAVALAFAPVARNGFLPYDDDGFIVRNAHVLGGLTAGGVRWALTAVEHANWHPLAWLGFMLDVQLFGLRAGAHHLASVAWHALAAVLLFLALRRTTGRPWPAAFAAGLFALHPQRVESVAWASELKDPLSGCFLMLALLAYAKLAARPSPLRLLVVAAALAAGLATKPTLVPLPLLLLLLDWWPLGRWRPGGTAPGRLLLEKLPLLLLSAAAAAVTWRAQVGAVVLENASASFPLPARLGNAAVSAVSYPGKMLWPAGLAAFYPHHGRDLPAWKAALAAAVLLGVTVLAVRRARRSPWLLAGWLWYLCALLPVAGIVQVGLQGMADRYTYVPLLGVAVALAWELAERLRDPGLPRWAPRAAGACALAVLLACAALTREQCGRWRSMAVLFAHSLEATGPNPVALASLAVGLNAEGRYGESVAALGRAVALMPEYPFARYVLGNALVGLGRREEAIASYREAVRLAPAAAEVRNNLGATLAEVGRPREAEEQLRAALRVRPGYPAAAENLARLERLAGGPR